MSTKGLLLLAVILILGIGGATYGIFLLSDHFQPKNSSSTPAASASSTPTPSTAPSLDCQTSDDCAWISKVVVTNSGQSNEKTDVTVSCSSANWLQSCGPDCQNRGNVHPYNKNDRCLCDQGTCEAQLQATTP